MLLLQYEVLTFAGRTFEYLDLFELLLNTLELLFKEFKIVTFKRAVVLPPEMSYLNLHRNVII